MLLKFTAKWCVNCIVLDKTIYHDAAVLDAMKAARVVPMKFDVDLEGWDRLKNLSFFSVMAFTAIYKPGSAEPIMLSGMHDTGALLDARAKAKSIDRR